MQVTMISSLPTTFVYIWHYGPTTYNIFSQLKNCYMKNRLRSKAMAPHSSTLAWKIPWMEEPGGLQSMGSWRVGHDWATSLSRSTFMHWRRKMATHSSVLAWRVPWTEQPGGLQSMGSLRVGHDWSDLAAAAAYKHPLLLESPAQSNDSLHLARESIRQQIQNWVLITYWTPRWALAGTWW